MSTFFTLLAFLAFVAFVVGMVKPGIVVFWRKKKTRGSACLYLVVMIIFAACTGSLYHAPTAASIQSSAVSAIVSSASTASAESNTAESETKAIVSAAESKVPSSNPVAKAQTNVKMDWNKCISDTQKGITGNSFPYVKDTHIEVDESKKLITFTAVLNDSASPQKALDYADTMVRQFNMNAMDQDDSIKSSTKDFYGGVYEKYSAMVGVAPFSQVDNTDKWFVYDLIAKGGINKLNLSKAYN